MKIKGICCEKFRNIRDLKLSAHPKMNILYGSNAQGKTNILEAIWLFTGQKSFQNARDIQMIQNGEEYANLSLDFQDSRREQNIKLRLEEKKRTILLNDVKLKSSSELCQNFSAVIFSPVHLDIAADGPSVRRRFLDDAISQVNIKYSDYLTQYEKVLDQRNSLLKDIKRYPSLEGTLDIWDMQLAKLGTIITIYRNDYISRLKKYASDIYEGFSKEKLKLEYSSTVFEAAENIKKYTDSNINIYYNVLYNSREKDTVLKYTSAGVHRDDLELSINQMAVRSYGSQGQKRSVVLTLKLSEARILKDVTGENPVILFDDVLSELDESRQEYLLNRLNNFQVFITCCDPANTTRHKSGKVFHIKNGGIVDQSIAEGG